MNQEKRSGIDEAAASNREQAARRCSSTTYNGNYDYRYLPNLYYQICKSRCQPLQNSFILPFHSLSTCKCIFSTPQKSKSEAFFFLPHTTSIVSPNWHSPCPLFPPPNLSFIPTPAKKSK